MKKEYLILIMAVLLSFGCQKREVVDPNIKPESADGLIELRSGATLSSRAANEGIRGAQFVAGDQIGVTAVFVDVEAAELNPEAALVANWADTMHFDNAPAKFSTLSGDGSLSVFKWGENGEGGIHNRYYPSRIREIFLVGYYPYSADNYTPGVKDATAELGRHPTLGVVLTDDMAPPVGPAPATGTSVGDVYTKDNHLKQADILRYADYTSEGKVASTNPLASMTFSHALAQIRFTLERSEFATICYFRKIEFHTVKRGVLNLATGDFTYAEAVNAREAFYEFGFSGETAPKIPIKGEEGAPIDILNSSYSVESAPELNYPMVFPLPKSIGKLGMIKLYTTLTDSPDDEAYQVYDIPLETLADFVAGGLNTMNITIAKVHIELKATIEAWGTGSQAELPAE